MKVKDRVLTLSVHTLVRAPLCLSLCTLLLRLTPQLCLLLRRSQITVTHRNTGLLRHRVRGFTPTSAADSKFTLKDGKVQTVAGYFK